MLDIQVLGTDFYHILNWFWIYGILGWIVESIYMSFCNKKLTNRGFIHGPICPIYGVGALTVYFILRPVSGNYFILYFCGAILATTLEYATALLMQKIFGCIWWDYNDKPFNYKGILCLESTIAWGFYTIFLFLFLQKWVQGIVRLYPRSIGKWFVIGISIYYLIDFSISLIGAIDLNAKLKKLSVLLEELQAYLKSFNIHKDKKKIQEQLESLANKDNQEIGDEKIRAIAEQYKTMRFRNFFLSRHFIKSYQAFRVWSRKEEENEKEKEETHSQAEFIGKPEATKLK